MVLQDVRVQLSKDSLPEDLGLFGLGNVLGEEADDFINRNNFKRTVAEWLQFAERASSKVEAHDEQEQT